MDTPALPRDAADLLAIGRRYDDVEVARVPKSDPLCFGRASEFWTMRAGPPGWQARRQETGRLVSPVRAAPRRDDGPRRP